VSEYPEVDKFAEAASEAFSTEYRKVVDTQLERVVRPWRILTAGLLAWDVALTILFVALFILWANTTP